MSELQPRDSRCFIPSELHHPNSHKSLGSSEMFWMALCEKPLWQMGPAGQAPSVTSTGQLRSDCPHLSRPGGQVCALQSIQLPCTDQTASTRARLEKGITPEQVCRSKPGYLPLRSFFLCSKQRCTSNFGTGIPGSWQLCSAGKLGGALRGDRESATAEGGEARVPPSSLGPGIPKVQLL